MKKISIFILLFLFSRCLDPNIWTAQNPHQNPANWAVYYRFMEGENESTARKTWTEAFSGDIDSFSKRYGLFGFAFSDTAILIGGINTSFGFGLSTKDSWINQDQSGASWSVMSVDTNSELGFVANSCTAKFNSRFWILGGVLSVSSGSNTVYNTDANNVPGDFTKWNVVTQTTPFDGRYGHTCGCMSDKIWIMGGGVLGNPSDFKTNVTSSGNGTVWTDEAALPTKVGFHCSVYFDSTLWVIGGRSNTKATNLVYKYDTVGSTWETVGQASNFPERFGHSCLVFDNKIWIIGGAFDESVAYDDVWSSPDGSTWTRDDHFVPTRVMHHSYVQNNRMWLVGGRSTIGSSAEEFNDVWYYTPENSSGNNQAGSSRSDETNLCN